MQLHDRVQHVLLYWAANLPDNLGQFCSQVLGSAGRTCSRANGMLEQLLLQYMQEKEQL
jgi:hypothetical protein